MRYPPALAATLIVLVGAIAPPIAAARPVDAPSVTSAPGSRVTLRAGHTSQHLRPIPRPNAAPGRDGQSAVAATADIEVTYTGFGGDLRGQAAQQVFEDAITVWESLVVSSQPIRVAAGWVNLGSGGILGSAGPSAIIYDSAGKKWDPIALSEATCGCARNGATAPDIEADFNSAFDNWYLLSDGAAGTNYDFFTVVLHEIGHGLGFLGSMDISGAYGEFGWWAEQAYRPMRYDELQYSDAVGGSPLVSFGYHTTALKQQLTDGSVFFGGSNVVATLGGRAALYAPYPWEPGSSNAHLDEATFPPGSTNALMTPRLSNGEVIHDPGPLTLAVFRDIGWTTTGPAPTAPDAPTDVTAVAGNGSAFVSWNPSENNGGSAVTTYTVTSAPDGVTCATSGTGCTLFPLTNDVPYTFTVVATNAAGPGPASSPSNEVIPNGSAPDLTAPSVASPDAFVFAFQRIGTTAQVRVSWPAAVDPSGISRYELERQKGTGVWIPIALATPTDTSADVAIKPNKLYSFRLRAIDGVNNVSDWVATAPKKLGLAQESSTAVGYTGKWKLSYLAGATGSYVRQTGFAGRSARLTFNGTSAAFVTTLARGRGIADIWLDGAQVGSLDLYSATTLTGAVAWSTGMLSPGVHTLDIVSTGTRNPAATKYRVDIDGFLVWP